MNLPANKNWQDVLSPAFHELYNYGASETSPDQYRGLDLRFTHTDVFHKDQSQYLITPELQAKLLQLLGAEAMTPADRELMSDSLVFLATPAAWGLILNHWTKDERMDWIKRQTGALLVGIEDCQDVEYYG